MYRHIPRLLHREKWHDDLLASSLARSSEGSTRLLTLRDSHWCFSREELSTSSSYLTGLCPAVQFMQAFDAAMQDLDEQYHFLASPHQLVSCASEEEKVSAHSRRRFFSLHRLSRNSQCSSCPQVCKTARRLIFAGRLG